MKGLMLNTILCLAFLTMNASAETPTKMGITQEKVHEELDVITLGGGCFWCVEAVFLELEGVEKVVSGYMGGQTLNPTYREICTGQTGHAEVIQIHFNKKIVDLETVLDVFWTIHDPTTLNRQGTDKGTQYRSAIFYYNEEQREVAEKSIKNSATELWTDKIVTELTSAVVFYPAEDKHQDYYNNNQNQGYCRAVINPKLAKFRKKYADRLKQ